MGTEKIEIKIPPAVRYWKQPPWVMKDGEAKTQAESWGGGAGYHLPGAGPLGCMDHQLESAMEEKPLKRTPYSVQICKRYAIALYAVQQLNLQWPGILFTFCTMLVG